MSDELKPCPFCGGAATFGANSRPDYEYIRCGSCKARTYSCYKTQQEAIEAWNTRAERTCRWVPFDEGHSIAGPGWRCSECGLELGPENAFVVEQCYCCPGCQSRVVDE